MNEKDLIALGHILGPAVLISIITLRKFRNKKLSNKLIREELLRSHARELYLASMLDKHGIELDEFDVIAFNEL